MQVLVDVDEEFVCYRYVNLDTNQEVPIIPKSGIIVNRDPPVANLPPSSDTEMPSLEVADTLQQRAEEENEIFNALKDVDMEYQQLSNSSTNTNTQPASNTQQSEITSNVTTNEHYINFKPAAGITSTTQTNTPGVDATIQIITTNTTEASTIEDPATETSNDDEVLLIKRPIYKRRHFKQLFIKGDNVVYVCADLSSSTTTTGSGSFLAHCKSKYPGLMYH